MFGEKVSCAIDYPARFARYTPGHPALVFGEEVWSWQDVDKRVSRATAFLVSDLGLKRGDRVALLAMNDPRTFVLLFACLRVGLTLAPMNTRLAPRELGQLLELCEPRLLVADAAHWETACTLTQGGPVALTGLLDMDEASRYEPPPLSPAELEDPALILFTSGTTGLPKAAVLPVRQLLVNATQTQTAFGLTAADSTVLYTPLFHTGAINVLAMPLFQCGGTVHIHPAFDAEAIWQTVDESAITTLFGVPTTFEMLAESPAFGRKPRQSLRLCLCGGAPLPVDLIKRWRGAGFTLSQGFGMTEAGPNCFFLPPDQALARAGSVGLPMPWARARVVDGAGNDVTPGEVGELWLAGPHVGLGYFRDPEATADAFAGEWFRTGDLARRDGDGYFYVAGRAKEMFISGGENVYPAEVEMALCALPEVSEAAVVPCPDSRWGEVGCAFVVAASLPLDCEGLRRKLRGELAAYKVPRRVVPVASLPRNPSGKVLKQQLSMEARTHAA